MAGSSDFERWLRQEQPRPAPREGFARGLRKRFLAGAAGDEGAFSVSRGADRLRKEDVSNPFEAFLRQQDESAVPRDGFRIELRGRFLRGAPDAARVPQAPLESGRPRGRLLRWMSAAAGVAAAVLALLFLLPRGETASWRVVSADATIRVDLDGRSVDLSQTGSFAGLLEADDGFAVTDGRLRLAYGDAFRMEVLPDSRLALGHDGGSDLRLFEGEVFLQTLAGYPGEGLRVATPESVVSVHGTTLGVLASEQGTCVCVLEGLVDVRDQATPASASVETCGTRFVFRDAALAPATKSFPADGAAPDPAYEAHLAPLRAFHADPWR